MRPHVFQGTLAWIERDGTLAVVRVRDTNRIARALRGRTVTIDLADARISAPDRDGDGQSSALDLLPGEQVEVRAAASDVPVDAPRVLTARQVVALDHAL